ncbi:N-acetylmannosaminyltransferase [Arcticibacter svalbardensis MN12-7]|uniref:N-acetylmannosaminyltransferase n=1 Tax=Arcticibacter svalbardensis MN12-7 TaxID=1150600 RepID=R9GS75_9SPHI|nr:WecB/TagA/CpsF family glycosyltransferase [Arcticibacter svalbardensis]EOR94571.1 N-acetylmannosaminyltransferase [Arcticibacter svalbardensis MN12-7]
MKILLIHTFYGQSGGEDQVFNNEFDLLSSATQVKKLCFDNSGNMLAVFFKFILGPYNIFSLIKFRKAIKELRPDVVHIHNWHFAASPLLIRAAKKMGIPVVVTLHNYRLLCPSATLFHQNELFTDSLSGGFPWKAVFKKVYRDSLFQTFWLASITYLHKKLKTWQKVDRYITLSNFARELFLQSDLHLKQKQLVVKSNFVKDSGYNIKNRSTSFLYVGRLSPEKGIELLISAFADTNFQLTIVGDGPLRNEVEQAAAKHSNITYLGKKSNIETMDLMRQANALIFPSIWFEGMPMTILEAFSTGTPVIASRLGSIQHLISPGYNGLLFKAGDRESLQSCLHDWQNLDPLSKTVQCIYSRKTYITNYTPEKNLDQLLNIYQSVIAPKQKTIETMKRDHAREITVLDFPVFNSSLDNIELKNKAMINTINQYSYIMSMKDAKFKEALIASDVLLPDGVGITMASKLLTGNKIKKIAGAELHQFLLEKLNKEGGSCFYLGSSEPTLEKIKAHVSNEFSAVKVNTYSPPFKAEFDEKDNLRMIEAINNCNPDILFIGMTAPKQEKWAHVHYNQVCAKTICSIGAVFDFYAGTKKRPSQFWINMRLEWFIRLLREPNRLWKRYLYYGPYFAIILINKKIKKSFTLPPTFEKQAKAIKTQ